MKLKVKIGDEMHEVGLDALELPDGAALVTPDNVPKGYFTQKAFDDKIAEITRTKTERAKEELKSDKDFHKTILSDYNISLGDDGKPKGLKPDFDPDEWKREQAKRLTEPYEKKVQEATERLNRYRTGMVKAELMKTASSLFKEEYVKSFTGDDEPYVVQKFSNLFDVDDSGVVALKDDTGFAVDGGGGRITPDKYFNMHRDKLGNMLADNRQRGANVGTGAPPSGKFSEAEIAKMSDAEYEKNREAILAQAGS